METSNKGGSLEEGLFAKQKITQTTPRGSGQGERPPKGDGTTIPGGNKKSKG